MIDFSSVILCVMTKSLSWQKFNVALSLSPFVYCSLFLCPAGANVAWEETFVDRLKPGDHVYIWSMSYESHAIVDNVDIIGGVMTWFQYAGDW